MVPADCFVVTGAAGVLGAAVARELSSRGAAVACVDVPATAARLEALAAELGPRSLAVPLDALVTGAWTEVVGRIESTLGSVSGAALIAGSWRGGAPLHADARDDTLRAMIAVNLETAERSLRALLPPMVARRRGAVVVVGSRAVAQPWTSAGAAAYAASKAGLVALAQAVAAEVLDAGVRVNAVLPSMIDTPANRAGMPDADPSRWVDPASLARVIAFLLSDDARDVSGAAIPVYGRA